MAQVALARVFDGVDDELRVAVGAGAFTPTNITMAILCKLTADSQWHSLMCCQDAATSTARYSVEIDPSSNLIAVIDGADTSDTGTTMAVSDGWCVVAMTRSGGAAGTWRAHKVPISGSPVHADRGTTAEGTSADSTIQFGEFESVGDRFEGHMLAAGIWNSALTDQQVESLAGGFYYWNKLAPRECWLFDGAVATPVASRAIAGTADQSAVEGTTTTSTGLPTFDDGRVAHDAQTRFPTTDGPSGTESVDTTTGDRAFNHTPSGTPAGVEVTLVSSASDFAHTGVTYGGIAMTQSVSAADTSEASLVYVYTLTGVAIPTGTQSVVIQGCNTRARWATCSTVTGGTGRTQVMDTTAVNTTTSADPQVSMTLTTGGGLSYGAIGYGGAAPPTTMLSGCTLQHQNDTGTRAQCSLRRTSHDDTTPVAVGATAVSDDWCAAAATLALADPPAASTDPVFALMAPLGAR